MKRVAIVSLASVALVAAAGATAVALTWDDENTRNGTCAAGVPYEFTVERDDDISDLVEISFEVRTAEVGEVWTVSLTQDGEEILAGERLTDDEAELDIDAVAQDIDAATYTVTASSESGTTCDVSLTR